MFGIREVFIKKNVYHLLHLGLNEDPPSEIFVTLFFEGFPYESLIYENCQSLNLSSLQEKGKNKLIEVLYYVFKKNFPFVKPPFK